MFEHFHFLYGVSSEFAKLFCLCVGVNPGFEYAAEAVAEPVEHPADRLAPGGRLDRVSRSCRRPRSLPDAPPFLAPGWYVNFPLKTTYWTSWEVAPKLIWDLVEVA